MNCNIQAKLLRFIEAHKIRPVGSSQEVDVKNCRIIAATSRDLERDVEDGRFLIDLYHRLSGVTISVPPLRQRREDIPLLIDEFLLSYNKRFSTSARAMLFDYCWQGNVRELLKVVARCAKFEESGEIVPANLPSYLPDRYEGFFEYEDFRRPIAAERQRIYWAGTETL